MNTDAICRLIAYRASLMTPGDWLMTISCGVLGMYAILLSRR